MVGEKKISELSLFGSLNGSERIPAIQDQSGVWVNGTVNANSIGANIGNTDLMLSGNRTLDFNNNTFGWLKVKQFNATAGVPPNVGEASFTFRGYGTTSSDLLMGVGNGASLYSRWFGNGLLIHQTIIPMGNGAEFYNYGSGGNGISVLGDINGIIVSGTKYGIQSSGDYGGFFGGITYGVRAVNNSSSATAIKAEQGIGILALHTDGIIQLDNLPTSASGLATGQIWNDAGTLKIV